MLAGPPAALGAGNLQPRLTSGKPPMFYFWVVRRWGELRGGPGGAVRFSPVLWGS